MGGAVNDFAEWADEIRRLAAEFQAGFESRYGYPPGDHVISGPTDPAIMEEAASRTEAIPAVLLDFYRVCGGVSLPDVGVGYFVVPLRRVLDGLDVDDPVRMRGSWDVPIVVFGSDGGGTLFALHAESGEPAYALPSGPVHDQVYEDSLIPTSVIADDLPGFLAIVRRALERPGPNGCSS